MTIEEVVHGESKNIEFKATLPEKSEKYTKTIVAFANTQGGLYNGLTYEEIMNGHSKIRNRVLANVFNQMGLVESWGPVYKEL